MNTKFIPNVGTYRQSVGGTSQNIWIDRVYEESAGRHHNLDDDCGDDGGGGGDPLLVL